MDDIDSLGMLTALILARKMRRKARLSANAPTEVDSTGPLKLAVDIPPVPTVLIVAGRARNEPCPCGSGKKHKKCCGRQGKAAPAAAPNAAPSSETESLTQAVRDEAVAKLPATQGDGMRPELRDVDYLYGTVGG